MWAMSLLTDAWAAWVFSAKANNSSYGASKPEATANAKIALPYVKSTAISAIEAGIEIGRNPQNNYRPENVRKTIYLEQLDRVQSN
jgi:hypothetical protein